MIEKKVGPWKKVLVKGAIKFTCNWHFVDFQRKPIDADSDWPDEHALMPCSAGVGVRVRAFACVYSFVVTGL